MAITDRQALSAVSPSQAGQGLRRVLTRAAAPAGLATAAILVAACGSPGGYAAGSGAGGNSGKAAAAGTISLRKLAGVGTALVNSSGMTIYTPKTPAEVNGNIRCTGPCLSFWFPVTAASVHTGRGDLPGKLGTVHRPDGKTQLTYNGRPLYTFRLDTSAGQAHGNDFSDNFNGTVFTWQVVTASGSPAAAGPIAPSSSPSYQPGY